MPSASRALDLAQGLDLCRQAGLDPDALGAPDRGVAEQDAELAVLLRVFAAQPAQLAAALRARDACHRAAAATALLDQRRRAAADLHRIVHDLRAPLRGVRNLVDWAVEDHGPALGAELRETLALVQEQTGRMDALVAGVRRISRAADTRCAWERVDLEAVVDTAWRLAGGPPGALMAVGLDACPAAAPVELLEEVLTELFENIVQHAVVEGPLRVSVRSVAAGPSWCLAVGDNGGPVPAHLRGRVFEPFVSRQPPTGPTAPGQGLAVVKALVTVHGGRVAFESGPRGTVVRLWLPHAPPPGWGADGRPPG